jgi:hypothetical protein
MRKKGASNDSEDREDVPLVPARENLFDGDDSGITEVCLAV